MNLHVVRSFQRPRKDTTREDSGMTALVDVTPCHRAEVIAGATQSVAALGSDVSISA
jgi:hypothetical protein